MKISVILGVCHMMLGIIQKGMNAYYFNRKLELVNEFIPQVLLMMCLFGYMDIMIIIKWLTSYEGVE